MSRDARVDIVTDYFNVTGMKGKQGDWGVIFLNRPPLNILNREMCELLTKFLLSIRGTKEYQGLMIATELDHFSAGADIGEHLPGKVETMLPAFHKLLLTVADFPLPTVAVIKGSCQGGGLELARACQYIVAADSGKVTIGVPETQLCCFPPYGVAAFPRYAGGRAEIVRHILSGKTLKLDTAENITMAYKLGWVEECHVRPLSVREIASKLSFSAIEPYPTIKRRFANTAGFRKEFMTTIRDEEMAKVKPERHNALKVAAQALLECSRFDTLAGALNLAEEMYFEQIKDDPNYINALTLFLERSKK
ncbi:MAG: enoyl-CoA hydratase/isomerase family protein [Patescibacteria group bacterium]